jgi:hypothetical protein
LTLARARELVFALYQRGLHPELLPVVRSETIERPAFHARLSLLEPAGHALSFAATRKKDDGGSRREGSILVEAVVSSGLELPRAGRVELRPLARTGREKVRARGGVVYECSFALETCAPSEFARRHEKILTAEPRGKRLRLDRGHPENEGLPAFSIVDYETKERVLDAFTVHTFPRERAFVFVQSSFAVAVT